MNAATDKGAAQSEGGSRRQILDHAARLLRNGGYHQTTLREIARDVLSISRDGLKRLARLNRDGYDETSFLNTLDEVVARGTTSAEEMLSAYHTRWGG